MTASSAHRVEFFFSKWQTKEKTMNHNKIAFTTIDEYIATFPKEVQQILKGLRKTIKAAAPDAEERISYQMPAFSLNGILVYFAAYKKHIGFYPGASGIQVFTKELSGYKGGKGSVQFPIDKPLPLALISKIVKFRVSESKVPRPKAVALMRGKTPKSKKSASAL
jgi:uncharacterized protein YdhG (YjbR/CyaY superfamily)